MIDEDEACPTTSPERGGSTKNGPLVRSIGRCTLAGEIPTWRASSRLDQWVAPSGVSSRVRTTTSSTWASVIVRGTPGRGSSPSPSSRRARNRARHLITVTRLTRSRAATAVLLRPSAQASTIRARSASPCAVFRRFAQFSNVRRSASDSTSGFSLLSPMPPADRDLKVSSLPSQVLRRSTTHVVLRELKTGTLGQYEQLADQAASRQKLDFEEIQIPPGPRLGRLVVESDRLVKGFEERKLIDGLSFSLPPAGIVGVIGPNGVGKTTLLKMILGQEQPDAGAIKVGKTVQISYVDQLRAAIDPDETVWEVISGGEAYLHAGRTEIPAAPTWRPSGSRDPTSKSQPGSCLAANVAGSTWRSPSNRGATCCCWTNPPTTWTWRP